MQEEVGARLVPLRNADVWRNTPKGSWMVCNFCAP